MININKVKADMIKASNSLYNLGFDVKFVDAFWLETLKEVKENSFNSARDEKAH